MSVCWVNLESTMYWNLNVAEEVAGYDSKL